MGLLDRLGSFFGLEGLHTRTVDPFSPAPTLHQQLALLTARHAAARPWRPSSINEALGVPAIFRAVSLIANTTGSLAVDGYRNGSRMTDTPRVIARPDPFRTPREFYRDSAYYLASRGICWWWIGARDTDGSALSLIVVPPWEVQVEPNDRDRLRPTIRWLNKAIRREDMVRITFLPDETGYLGVGPLQVCGAAVSVTVEAQEWAANFYADGGYPNILIKSLVDMTEDEVTSLREQWTAMPSNMPKIITPTIGEVKELGADVAAAQMLEARNYQVGDAARMFGIPGSLLEYSQPGAALTYQNLESEYTKFLRTCLQPNYLEPIEQAMSDLLPRSAVARFNVEGLLRADIKTRYEVYTAGIASGVLTSDEARQAEGLSPGNIEFQPVPFAPPAAVPSVLPIQSRSLDGWRCSTCGKKIAEARGVGTKIRCRCGVVNEAIV